MIKNTDIKLKGHGSFYLREGWIKKGLLAIENKTFSKEKEDMIDDLGVGSNMVPAIKYWLKAVMIAEDKKVAGGKNILSLTKIIGENINRYDSYIEENGTIALMHYKLVNSFKQATAWYILFNKMNIKEFSKRDAEDFIYNYLSDKGYTNLSLASIDSDVQCVIKSYLNDMVDSKGLDNPEMNNICPFVQLGLLVKSKDRLGQAIYIKKKIAINKLNKLIFLYIILEKSFEGKGRETTIEKILEEPGNIGSIFNLDINDINEYLDELSMDGYLTINRTSGLNQIYIKKDDLTLEIILEKYYKKNV